MAQVQQRTRELPYAKTKMAQFLAKHIDGMKGIKSQSEIARDLGYDRPNIISMFKTGDTRVPLDKVPALARAIEVDMALLMRLGLEQYWPGELRALNEMFARIVTEHEMEIVQIFREATNDEDPKVDIEQKEKLRKIFSRR